MKRQTILGWTVAAFVVAGALQGCNGEKKGNIAMEVEGIPGDSCLWYVEGFPMSPMGETLYRDTLAMTDGRLELDVESDTLYKICLTPATAITRKEGMESVDLQKVVELYLQKGKPLQVKVTVKNDYSEYAVKGDPLTERYAERTSQFREEYASEIAGLYATLMQLNAQEQFDTVRFEQLNNRYMEIFENYRCSNIAYAQAHLQEELAGVYLVECAEDSLLAIEAEKLSPEVRGGILKPLIDARLKVYHYQACVRDNRGNVRPGCKAPGFDYKDLDGNDVSLQQFAGQKYVVLDFWGTWCSWCMKGMPAMREYYHKYQDRVAFIGVNCNDKEEKCRKAVQEQQMDWIQLINDEDLDKSISLKYAVQAYPTKIIIAPDGTIAGYFEGESEEFYQKLDELLK